MHPIERVKRFFHRCKKKRERGEDDDEAFYAARAMDAVIPPSTSGSRSTAEFIKLGASEASGKAVKSRSFFFLLSSYLESLFILAEICGYLFLPLFGGVTTECSVGYSNYQRVEKCCLG